MDKKHRFNVEEHTTLDGKTIDVFPKCHMYIHELEQRVKEQKEVIDKAIKKINDYKIYCKENKGFTEYTDIEIEAIEPILIKMEDILNEVSEW